MPDQSAAPPSGGSSRPARRRWAFPLVLGLIGALVGITGYVVVADPNGSGEQATTTATSRPTATTRADPDSVVVYKKILPSLVYVETHTTGDDGALGSGVIVNEQGQILTALHVVDERDHDRGHVRRRHAVGRADREQRIPRTTSRCSRARSVPNVIVPAVLGGGVRVGDEAFPVGNPLGFAGSITAGRRVGARSHDHRENGEGDLDGLIQFDAAVNPGSSGGPLLNRDGQVVGIVTALANPTGRNVVHRHRLRRTHRHRQRRRRRPRPLTHEPRAARPSKGLTPDGRRFRLATSPWSRCSTRSRRSSSARTTCSNG